MPPRKKDTENTPSADSPAEKPTSKLPAEQETIHGNKVYNY